MAAELAGPPPDGSDARGDPASDYLEEFGDGPDQETGRSASPLLFVGNLILAVILLIALLVWAHVQPIQVPWHLVTPSP